MASSISRLIVDLIASGASANEVREAVNSGLFEASMDCVEDYKAVVGDRYFDEAANVVTKGAKAAMPMTSVKKEKLARAPKDAQARKQNNELLATGENAAGGIEVDMYPGETPKRGAMGHMNPLGVPQKSYAGDRRKGFIPPGGGV